MNTYTIQSTDASSLHDDFLSVEACSAIDAMRSTYESSRICSPNVASHVCIQDDDVLNLNNLYFQLKGERNEH